MYYRRQGEPQEMYGNGNNSVSSSAVNTYQPYYKEDFNILDPALSDSQRYIIYAIVAAILLLLFWLLYKKYGHKIGRKGSVSMFY
ncbi:141R [Invertebrate iridescent virus 6]|uniref:Uncharacterized protein 141R n=1 Tax=Invertebrate iridescent virus 6 TaxID=176652 RepID=141R_IIV6|nr:141R [Invertebrate iridescent virus 6]O55747.1 RecName: Full=Uncharacterized protein 141R [Invertebrate iridescent virus 6]AAB94458.1 141R [Invertebrate iridescent virus 6]QMS79386.1 hypothetical protein IIV6-T1_145 [Invertebrate iridescent virus 6]